MEIEIKKEILTENNGKLLSHEKGKNATINH